MTVSKQSSVVLCGEVVLSQACRGRGVKSLKRMLAPAATLSQSSLEGQHQEW